MPKKTKRTIKIKRGTLTKCFTCPPEHKGWMRSQLKNRKKVPYCPECIKIYDKQQETMWPACPQCESETEFGYMRWGGTVENTMAFCEDCKFEVNALAHFDYYIIKATASPIDRRYVSPSVGGYRE